MIEASATRRPSTPRTLRSSDTTAIGSSARPSCGARGMEHGLGDRAHVIAQRAAILLEARRRQHAALDEFRERRRLADADREFDAAHQRFDILLDRPANWRRTTRESPGLFERSRTLPRDCGRSTQGPIEMPCPGSASRSAKPMNSRQHMELHVGFARARRCPRSRRIRRRSKSASPVLVSIYCSMCPTARRPLSSPTIEIGSLTSHCTVASRWSWIVGADAGQIDDDFDAVFAQMRRRADARKLQDFRRRERARGQDHLAPRRDLRPVLEPNAVRRGGPRIRPYARAPGSRTVRLARAFRLAQKRLRRAAATAA